MKNMGAKNGHDSSYTLRNKRVWVAGDRGLVGSALIRRLQREGCELLTAPRESVDLRRPDQVERWMAGQAAGGVSRRGARRRIYATTRGRRNSSTTT